MTQTPKLVRSDFYHRPVAAIGEAESFHEKIASIQREVPRQELESFALKVLTFDANRARDEADTYESRQEFYDHMDYIKALRDTRSVNLRDDISYVLLRKRMLKKIRGPIVRWQLRRRSRFENRQSEKSMTVRVLRGFVWYPYEGSRYPARYEPVYDQYAVTATGIYVADFGTGYSGGVWIKCTRLSATSLFAIWAAKH
jgi:hypothetical protein